MYLKVFTISVSPDLILNATGAVYRAGRTNAIYPACSSVAHELWCGLRTDTVRRLLGFPRASQDILRWSLASVRHMYVVWLFLSPLGPRCPETTRFFPHKIITRLLSHFFGCFCVIGTVQYWAILNSGGRLIEYQPFWLGLGVVCSLVSSGS